MMRAIPLALNMYAFLYPPTIFQAQLREKRFDAQVLNCQDDQKDRKEH